ncbi:hypothetical protein GCM10010171_39800 [Actinokineospora fastidiosa]|uniref:Uncharacterized protein n=1 Tax=Actinokineospora fastidiosa TaxID=1816 RepID=A0A918GIT0_9PSEU|nr:hypothetical protein GCM10010171_39800 [Actinokineospora fastidiosa]
MLLSCTIAPDRRARMCGKHGPDQRGGAEHVHVEQRPQFGVGGLLDRPDVRAARVVDQHVDPPVLGDDLGDGSGDGDVEPLRDHL